MVLTIEEIKKLAKPVTSVDDKRNYNNIIKLVNELVVDDVEDELNERRLRFVVMSLFQIMKKLLLVEI